MPTGFYQSDGAAPVLVETTDHRLTAQGVAEAAFSFFRSNITLARATTTVVAVNGIAPPLATTLVEYVLPNNDLVLRQPGPAMSINFNRAELLPIESVTLDPMSSVELDVGDAVPPFMYWAYRATIDDGSIEQRIRLGTAPTLADDRVRAIFYIRDFTEATT